MLFYIIDLRALYVSRIAIATWLPLTTALTFTGSPKPATIGSALLVSSLPDRVISGRVNRAPLCRSWTAILLVLALRGHGVVRLLLV